MITCTQGFCIHPASCTSSRPLAHNHLFVDATGRATFTGSVGFHTTEAADMLIPNGRSTPRTSLLLIDLQGGVLIVATPEERKRQLVEDRESVWLGCDGAASIAHSSIIGEPTVALKSVHHPNSRARGVVCRHDRFLGKTMNRNGIKSDGIVDYALDGR